MLKITKEDIREAFNKDKRKKASLLYKYYKDDYWDKDLLADFIRMKISEDLGIEIKLDVIYNINKRYHKKEKKNEDFITTNLKPEDKINEAKGEKLAVTPIVFLDEKDIQKPTAKSQFEYLKKKK